MNKKYEYIGFILFFLSLIFLNNKIDNIQETLNEIKEVNKVYQEEINELEESNKHIKSKIDEILEPQEYILEVSAYTPSIDECNNDIANTATMVKPKPGYHVAVSQDLIWMLGHKIYIEGYGVRKVVDLMNKRYEKSMDIMVGTKSEAFKFGRKKLKVAVLR